MALETHLASTFIKSATVSEEPAPNAEYVETALKEGAALWNAVKAEARNPTFANLPDNKKIELFSVRFHSFNREFPIVSRYLVCMGQYSKKAFKRYLDKIQKTRHPEAREKGYMEDQWVRRQADYVRYLWESYTVHYSRTDSNSIWQEAYKALSQEFTEFRSNHSKIKEKLEKADQVNKKELTRELLERLASGTQTLDSENMNDLMEVMQFQLARQRREKLMTQIKNSVPEVSAVRESVVM